MILPAIMNTLLDRINKKYNDSSDDTEYQILSRISSLETLDRCKVVCKRWYNIINEASFMPTYCQNTGNMYSYLLQVQKNEPARKYSQWFASINRQDGSSVLSSNSNLKFDDDVQILASSMQGIVFFAKHFEQGGAELYVCKPTTAQWQPIPFPESAGILFGLIILSNKPLRYKIVWISRDRSEANCFKYWHEIFDSKTWKWSERLQLPLPSCEQSYNEKGIRVGIFLYFLMDTFVLTFHGYNEKSIRIRFPEPSTSSHLVRKKIIEYQGKLGLICMTLVCSSSMQLWILEDHREMTTMRTWKQIKEVDMSFLDPNSGVVYPVGFYSANILVLKKEKSVLFCNIQDFTYKELKLNSDGYYFETFPFRSDKEAVDLRLSDSVTCLRVDADWRHVMSFSAFITFLLSMVREKIRF